MHGYCAGSNAPRQSDIREASAIDSSLSSRPRSLRSGRPTRRGRCVLDRCVDQQVLQVGTAAEGLEYERPPCCPTQLADLWQGDRRPSRHSRVGSLCAYFGSALLECHRIGRIRICNFCGGLFTRATRRTNINADTTQVGSDPGMVRHSRLLTFESRFSSRL